MPRNPVFPRRAFIRGLLVACGLGVYVTPGPARDDSNASVAQLIDDLTQIDSQAPGINSAAIYDGFIAANTPGSFEGGVLGVAPPRVPPQMSELVRRGPVALPELLEHLDDRRPTKLEVGNDDSPRSSHQVGVDVFAFSFFSDEYDPRLPRKRGPTPMEKGFRGRYTVKVGDVCYVLIGQIVNRRLLAVRYQASAGLVVNSPIETPALAEKVRNDWVNTDSEVLRASLLADIHAANHPGEINRVYPALERLRLYFPDTYKALDGDNLKKKREFEWLKTSDRRVEPPTPGASSAKLKKELASQHFSGVLEGDVRFKTLGALSCGTNSLRVVFYEWHESSSPGKAVHSSYRVILMHGATYIGSYVVEDKPSIQGDELRFLYGANGNSVRCGIDGAPPKRVLLDGAIVSLAK